MRRLSVLAGLFLTFALPAFALAQSSVTYNDATLTSLYEAYLKKDSNDTYLEKRIADERAKIRTKADEEVQGLVEPSEEELATDAATLPKAIDRQRSLVTLLQERLRELKVDVDLLDEEERRFYLPGSGTGAVDVTRLTETHGELLAKKAILTERINAFDAGLSLQEDRLGKLSRQQWFEQFRSLFGFGGYLVIIVGAIILDRLLRRRIAGRIEKKGHRYLAAKIVTIFIYTVAALWLLSKMLSEHPGALASLAIVGAGIAFALQDVVKDVMGWVLILQRHIFSIGNRVSIGPVTGDVIDIGLLRTTMLEVNAGTGAFNAHERTGKVLYVPNSLVIKEPVLNYNKTSDFMNVEMNVTVTYDSNWQKAQAILHDALMKETMEFTEQARKQQRRRTALYYTMWEVGDPEVHTDIADSGILFTLKFTVPIGSRRTVVTKLSHSILEQFDAASGIRLACPTT